MANDRPTDRSKLSRDRETIRGWVEDHGGQPVRNEATGDVDITVGEPGESHQAIAWDSFFDELDRTDGVVVYHGEDGGSTFEVVERGQALGRTEIDSEEVERALLEGETVTSHVTETAVVERTVVEEATLESEVVDREVVDERFVEADLLTRDVTECRLTETGEEAETVTDPGRFEEGHRSAGGFDVEVEVDEGWSVTKEQFERLTVESRVTDTDVTETDEVESDTVESSVDIENVERSIVDSGILDTGETASTGEIHRDSLRTEFGEDDTIETRLVQRRTIEEEITLRRRLHGEITEGETTAAEVVDRRVVESEVLDAGEYDEDLLTAGMAAGSGSREEGTTEAEAADRERGDLTVVSQDDQGKDVVGEDGEDLGIVSEVEGGTLYIDPHPSLTDRIKAKLDWGDEEEGGYPVGSEKIKRITDDEVVLVSSSDRT